MDAELQELKSDLPEAEFFNKDTIIVSMVKEEEEIQLMHQATANRPGVGGLRLERPLVITETGNELLSKLPFDPYIVER